MPPNSLIYPHAITGAQSITPTGENESILSMLDDWGNQVTLRLRGSAIDSLRDVLGKPATGAPE